MFCRFLQSWPRMLLTNQRESTKNIEFWANSILAKQHAPSRLAILKLRRQSVTICDSGATMVHAFGFPRR